MAQQPRLPLPKQRPSPRPALPPGPSQDRAYAEAVLARWIAAETDDDRQRLAGRDRQE